jgi:hypothetical protein
MKGPEGFKPPEASYRHLPETHSPPSLQKVRGFVEGLTTLRNTTIAVPKILLFSWKGKRKIAENCLWRQPGVSSPN